MIPNAQIRFSTPIKWLFLLLLFPKVTFSQTAFFEELVEKKFFTIFISELKDSTSKYLSSSDKLKLKSIKIQVDSSGANNYNINSDSKNRIITISSNLVRMLMRYSVAQEIASDKNNFDRRRFAQYYLSMYSYLSPEIQPEDAAELTINQKQVLSKICSSNDFQWSFKTKIQYLYLHELAHQLQDYHKQVTQIEHQKISLEKKKEKLLQIEMQADQFAIEIVNNFNQQMRNYRVSLDFLQLVRAHKFLTSKDLALRQINFTNYQSYRLGCSEGPENEYCKELEKEKKRYTLLLSNHIISEQVIASVIKDTTTSGKSIYLLYNLGDLYLKGSETILPDLAKALSAYQLASTLEYDAQRESNFSLEQFTDSKEYCMFMAAKLYELKFSQPKKAVTLYQKSSEIAHLFPKDYYNKIISRLSQE